MSNQTDQRSYIVAGMTCNHCARAVERELSTIPGVDSVDVDLASGGVKVSGQALQDASIRAAFEEAGYEVAA